MQAQQQQNQYGLGLSQMQFSQALGMGNLSFGDSGFNSAPVLPPRCSYCRRLYYRDDTQCGGCGAPR